MKKNQSGCGERGCMGWESLMVKTLEIEFLPNLQAHSTFSSLPFPATSWIPKIDPTLWYYSQALGTMLTCFPSDHLFIVSVTSSLPRRTISKEVVQLERLMNGLLGYLGCKKQRPIQVSSHYGSLSKGHL